MAATFQSPSQAVLDARARRSSVGGVKAARIEWFIDEVSSKIALTMRQRVRLATDFVMYKVVQNISTAVVKGKGPKGGKVTIRSKPGEFPRADTTQLMKTIFTVYENRKNQSFGYVGTPLDYGLTLELKMNRKFLSRTLNEERTRVMRILTGPIR